MRAGWKRVLLGVVVLAGVVGVAITAFRMANPYARLDRLAKAVTRVSAAYPRPYRIGDHLVGILHQSDPFDYYCRELKREEQRLLSSGHLVVAQLPWPEGKTEGDLLLALSQEYRRTGAFFRPVLDRTNRTLAVICKPGDAATFEAAAAGK
ncbi:MAG: hypothetical protein N3I86_10220 [Verrucomicrobiae bacterium]|nr:hypothetical protein [Verrucomicrobiae bacterium]MDW8308793.1 hypothetical protein [Verrucomicrobiales bacterium]